MGRRGGGRPDVGSGRESHPGSESVVLSPFVAAEIVLTSVSQLRHAHQAQERKDPEKMGRRGPVRVRHGLARLQLRDDRRR